MARRRSYWRGFFPLAVGSLGLLFLFVFGLMPQRFLLDLDFAESGFAYPVVLPPLPLPEATPPLLTVRPIARGPSERFWAEYLTLVKAGDLEAALLLLEDYLQRHPADADAALEYGRALWRSGRLEAAIEPYRTAITLGAGPEARRELARLLVATRRWDEALALYAALAAESPEDLELLREYARALIWAERYEQALSVYHKLVESSPNDLELLREYAAVATWAQRYDIALDLYARLVALAPEDAELRLEYARVLLWAWQPEAAAEVLAGLPPDFAGPGVDSLRADVELALPVASDTAVSLLDQARALAWLGDADSVLVLYRRYLAEHPDADSVFLEMADIFQFRAGAPDSAMAYLNAYLVRHPDALDVQLRIAWLHAWSGRFYEAETMARAVLAADPDNAEAWILMGDLYRWQGERKRAAEAYRRALEIDPWVVGAREGLAALDEQVDVMLAGRGSVGAAGGFEHFADSDDFSLTRLHGGWSGGSPRTRMGFEMGIEELSGLDVDGGSADLFALDVAGEVERWFFEGDLHARLAAGAWIPDGSGSSEPTVALSLESPNWRGAAYKIDYRHGPAYRETSTFDAAVANLRADALALEHYRPLTQRWDLSAQARGTVLSGVAGANLRTDASLGLFFKADDRWMVGYQTRGLAFSDPAPSVGRSLYWDPLWSWSHVASVSWRSEPASGWELGAWVSPGFAWLRERGSDPTLVAEFAATIDARRQIGVWTLEGRVAASQSRADGYRSLRLEFAASRGFDQ